MEESNLTNLFTGYKSFGMINIKNSSIPTVSVPDYLDYIDGAVYDPVAGVVRACGGEEFNNDVDRCFMYNGLEWSEMAPMCEPWDESNQGRISFFIPNVGWWILALKYSCGGGCNDIRSCLYNTDTNTWSQGPSLPTPEQYGYEYVPANFCSALVNETHVMVTGGDHSSGPPISDVWIYNFLVNEWTPGPNMTRPRKDHSCVGISGGRVIVAGGESLGGDVVDMEMFDPAADNGKGGWYAMGDLPENDSEDRNQLMQYGGNILWINRQRIWSFDLTEMEWQLFDKELSESMDLDGSSGRGGRAIMVPEDF